MTAGPETISAVMLVRVWLEDGELVRARITESHLSDGRDEVVHVVGTAAEIEHRVRSWIEQLSAPRLSPPRVTPR
ncbi:MAG TPA: hypothetical protein VFB87_07660 [Gaiellaceae bacterium]|jgi:hypothetical protein|nr:hypothetical protein [Gaiellaceae bacterium]